MYAQQPLGIMLVCLLSLSLCAQNIEVNKANKTIAVTATADVKADAEVAIVKVGYHNTNTNKDLAFRENVRVAGEILKALEVAGVPKEAIETETLDLTKKDPDDDEKPVRRPAYYEARQTWNVRVAAADAQKIADLSVRAGANDVGNVDWVVTDPVALEVKAYERALMRARTVAEQMAKSLNAKLGELVYATNDSQGGNYGFANSFVLSPRGGGGGGKGIDAKSNLIVFAQKVEQSATVRAIFAIE